MKKIICILISIIMVFSLVACSGSGDETSDLQNAPQSQASNDSKPKEDPFAGEKVDVDLTALSSTMVYSEVYNMMEKPDGYIGKTVKMKGNFSVYHDEMTDKYYFACLISDATACCSQGMEFELAGEHKYPQDYPELNDEITVVGSFTTYMEGETRYCLLANAKMA